MPDERKSTVEEAAMILIEAGYDVARPGTAGIPKKWADIINLGVRLLLLILASYTAGDLVSRPKAATPEQVKESVKEVTPTPEQIAVKVWER